MYFVIVACIWEFIVWWAFTRDETGSKDEVNRGLEIHKCFRSYLSISIKEISGYLCPKPWRLYEPRSLNLIIFHIIIRSFSILFSAFNWYKSSLLFFFLFTPVHHPHHMHLRNSTLFLFHHHVSGSSQFRHFRWITTFHPPLSPWLLFLQLCINDSIETILIFLIFWFDALLYQLHRFHNRPSFVDFAIFGKAIYQKSFFECIQSIELA